jgi:hypothetical protein
MERFENPTLRRQIIDHLAEKYQIREHREVNHLSTYIGCLTKAYWNETQPLPPTEREILLFSRGYALQEVITPADAEIKTLEKNGIIYRPDMVYLERLGEIKTTMKNAKGHYDSVTETWVDYMMGGCVIADKDEYDLAVMYLLAPDIKCDIFKFNKEELSQAWERILARKYNLEMALMTKVPPQPGMHCYKWECQYSCRYQLICDTYTGGLR